LLLTSGELETALSNHGFVGEREQSGVMDKVVATCLLAGLIKHLFELALRVGSRVKAVENIVANVTREQHWFLLDDADVLVVPLGVKHFNVHVVEQDGTLARLVEMLDQRNN